MFYSTYQFISSKTFRSHVRVNFFNLKTYQDHLASYWKKYIPLQSSSWNFWLVQKQSNMRYISRSFHLRRTNTSEAKNIEWSRLVELPDESPDLYIIRCIDYYWALEKCSVSDIFQAYVNIDLYWKVTKINQVLKLISLLAYLGILAAGLSWAKRLSFQAWPRGIWTLICAIRILQHLINGRAGRVLLAYVLTKFGSKKNILQNNNCTCPFTSGQPGLSKKWLYTYFNPQDCRYLLS